MLKKDGLSKHAFNTLKHILYAEDLCLESSKVFLLKHVNGQQTRKYVKVMKIIRLDKTMSETPIMKQN
jgi:hypothetical protein